MSSVWDDNLKHFRNRLASAEPAPGGGSAAMVSAALGCGLLMMAAEIASKKDGSDPRLSSAMSDLHILLENLSRHADEDIAAYETYVAARKLPSGTDEEKAGRKLALERALARATEAPVEAIRDALKALRLGLELAPMVHAGILSDIGAGASLLEGGIHASLFTFLSNIRLMQDPDVKQDSLDLYESMKMEVEELSRTIKDIVRKGLA